MNSGTIDLFTLLALIAAVVAIFKLRSVLGRRTGDDDTRLEQRARRAAEEQQRTATASGSDKVVPLPRRDRDEAAAEPAPAVSLAEREERLKGFASGDEVITKGLMEVSRADPAFDPEQFMAGAKRAYEMIVTAFAEGNLKTLRELLNKDVYDGFAGAISERAGRGEQVDQSFVGISKADILEADVRGGKANITVRFVSQLITAIRNRAGDVITGDANRVKDVTDIWTFSRDVSSARARQQLNWTLVSTQSPN
jgi:predicted lipid-binding transport protein (Tim44 family)